MISVFRQIKYAFWDIKIHKRISLIFFFQMIVVFLLVNSSITDIISVNNGLNRLKKLQDNKAYVNRDSTSNGKIDALIAEQENSLPKLKELYKYIIDSDKIDKFSKWEYSTNEIIDGHSVVQATTTNKFFDMYSIKVIKGYMFDESDFLNNPEIIPIIVGYNLKERYKLGQTYLAKDPATNKKITYKVIGILEHNASYPSIFNIGKEVNLNYTFFKPINIKSLNDFGSLDMAISSTIIFTNDENKVNSIEKKSIELGLFSMNYRPIQEYMKDYLDIFSKKMIYQLFIAVIVLLFASISMALNLITMISKNMKEFSIHLICGGRITSILQRILWRLLIILSIALIPTVLIFGINISLIYTMITACFILLAIMIIPYIKMKKTNIAQLVRRSE